MGENVGKDRAYHRRHFLKLALLTLGIVPLGCAGGVGRSSGRSSGELPSPFGQKSSRPGSQKSWWRNPFAKTNDRSPKTMDDFLKLRRITP